MSTHNASIRKAGTHGIALSVVMGACCLACIAYFVFGVSTDAPQVENPCLLSDDSGLSEAYTTLLMFSLGYLCTLATKHWCDIVKQVGVMARRVQNGLSSMAELGGSCLEGIRAQIHRVQFPTVANMAILATGSMCVACIVVLLRSAFTAEIGALVSESVLQPESSACKEAFTVGWICVTAFHLQRHSVGKGWLGLFA